MLHVVALRQLLELSMLQRNSVRGSFTSHLLLPCRSLTLWMELKNWERTAKGLPWQPL